MPASANSQKGFAHLVVILLLLAGLGFVVFLVGQKTNLIPKAYDPGSNSPIVIPTSATDKSVTLIPTKTSYAVGEQFGVYVYVKNTADAANLYSLKIKFPTDKLSLSATYFAGTGYLPVTRKTQDLIDNTLGTYDLVAE